MYWQMRSSEIAAFLCWFVEHERIPPLSVKGTVRAGGVSALAWSYGASIGLSFFAHADVYSRETRALLEKYLRSLIIYGMSSRRPLLYRYPYYLALRSQCELFGHNNSTRLHRATCRRYSCC